MRNQLLPIFALMNRWGVFGCALLTLVIATTGCSNSSCEQADKDSATAVAGNTNDKKTGDHETNHGTKTDPVNPDNTNPDNTNPDNGNRDPDKKDDDNTDGKAKVTLGDPTLTGGIPGDGMLTVKQIEDWLDDTNNHHTLEVELPFGLAAGASDIKGLQKNPLTRAKIELGRQLYFEKRLSIDSTVSCADCHHPDEGYARHTQFGVGIKGKQGNRNSPVSYNRILSGAQFWDGRAGSLEEQAVGPIANPIEMGNTHENAVETLKKVEGYRLQFDSIFTDGVTIENVGAAIASFERAIVTGPSPFDYYQPLVAFEEAFAADLEDLEGLKEDDPELFAKYKSLKDLSDLHPISESARRGMTIFFTTKGNCSACHAGANLADENYHNLGVGMDAEKPDIGRFAVSKDEKDRGAFKTPTIRNVFSSGPYMHDGSLKTLEEVVEWYDQGGHKNPSLSDKIIPLKLTDQEKKDLVEFMKACSGKQPEVETGRLPQ